MTMQQNLIRLFVSSTFADFKAERDLLQQKVFPRLRRDCLSKGMRFQAIDLRWGVSDEAGHHNQTMQICLRELRRCQQIGTKPNFLILLGERYGWRPLPESMPSELFECLRTQMGEGHPHAKLLSQIYREDNNAKPHAYRLQPRPPQYEDWFKNVETPLLAVLEQAAERLGCKAETEALGLGLSATHREIVHGALAIEDAREHVHAFTRRFRGEPNHQFQGDSAFIDGVLIGSTVTESHLERLKNQLKQKSNVHDYTVDWREDGIYSAVDQACFEEIVYLQLKAVIDRQPGQPSETQIQQLEEEKNHDAFGRERRHGFLGRQEQLQTIDDYIAQGTGKPLVVLGVAGAGKSALMAEAARQAHQRMGGARLIERYIGATSASSGLITLLRDLVGVLQEDYPKLAHSGDLPSTLSDLPFDLPTLIEAFHEILNRVTEEKPLLLFIDALDQLNPSHNAHQLQWLPWALPAHVRLIISTTTQGQGQASSQKEVFNTVRQHTESKDCVLLGALERDHAERLLEQWLDGQGRQLQPGQKTALLDTFEIEGNPLWLRVAANEAAQYASWEALPNFPPDTPGLLRQALDKLSNEENHGRVLVESALGYLTCTRNGLAEDEMLDVLSMDAAVMADFRRRSPDSPVVETLPVSVWVALHGDISRYLTETTVNGTRTMRFYHRSFKEAAEAFSLSSETMRRQRNRHLADYFAGVAMPNITEAISPAQQRMAAELIYHLVNAQAWGALNEKLENPEFLTGLVKFQFIRQALLDILPHKTDWIPESEPFYTVAMAANEQLNYLEENPPRTLQTLYNAVFALVNSPLRTKLLAQWQDWMQGHFQPYTDAWIMLAEVFPRHLFGATSLRTKYLSQSLTISKIQLDRGYVVYQYQDSESGPVFIKAEHFDPDNDKSFGPVEPHRFETMHLSPDGQTVLLSFIEIAQNSSESLSVLIADQHGRTIHRSKNYDPYAVCDFLDDRHLLLSRNGKPCIIDMAGDKEFIIPSPDAPCKFFCIAPDSAWFALSFGKRINRELWVYRWQDGQATPMHSCATDGNIVAVKSFTSQYIGWRESSDIVTVMAIDTGEILQFNTRVCRDFAFDPKSKQLFWVNGGDNMVYVQQSTEKQALSFDIGMVSIALWSDGKILIAEGLSSCQFFGIATIVSNAQPFILEDLSYSINSGSCSVGNRLFAVGRGNDAYLGEYGKKSRLLQNLEQPVRFLRLNESKTRLFIQVADGDCVVMYLTDNQVISKFKSTSVYDLIWFDTGLVALQGHSHLRFINEQGQEISPAWPSGRLVQQTQLDHLPYYDLPELDSIQAITVNSCDPILQCAVKLNSKTVSFVQIHSFNSKGQPLPIPIHEIKLESRNQSIYFFWPFLIISNHGQMHIHRQSPDCLKVYKSLVIDNIEGLPVGITHGLSPLLITRSSYNRYELWNLQDGNLCGRLFPKSDYAVINDGNRLVTIDSTRTHHIYDIIRGSENVPLT